VIPPKALTELIGPYPCNVPIVPLVIFDGPESNILLFLLIPDFPPFIFIDWGIEELFVPCPLDGEHKLFECWLNC